MSYAAMLDRKLALSPPTGLTTMPALSDALYKLHQQALIRWALRRGRAAIFADTGLGKTRMELAWADAVTQHAGKPVVILTPLAVAAQACREAGLLGMDLTHCRSDSDVRPGLNVINYERLHLVDPARFGGVVLDESSIIKHHDTKTLAALLAAFAGTPFKLCASATPAPNDWTELATHAEFLGICSRQEMLAEFFVHDGAETQVWRLKGHARELFWRWVSAWGAMVRRPSDLGYDDTGYILPPLKVREFIVDSDMAATDGRLFALEAATLSERRNARKHSMVSRIQKVIELIHESWTNSKSANTTGSIGSQIGTTSSRGAESGTRRMPSAKESAPGHTPPHQSGEPSAESRLSVIESARQSDGANTCASATRTSAPNSSPRTKSGARARGAAEQKEIGCCAETSASASTTTSACCPDRAAAAPFAEPPNQQTGPGSPSIIATQAESSGASCASPATTESADSRTIQASSGARPNTSKTQWVVWCELNAEQDEIARLLGDDCVSIYGSLDPDEKLELYRRFERGDVAVLITKPSMFGYGVNMQFCNHAAFVGVTDSFEAYYQTIRRQWRFGQRHPVYVHVVASVLEGPVLANLKRKEADAAAMGDALSRETGAAVREAVLGTQRQTNSYNARQAVNAPGWLKTEAA